MVDKRQRGSEFSDAVEKVMTMVELEDLQRASCDMETRAGAPEKVGMFSPAPCPL